MVRKSPTLILQHTAEKIVKILLFLLPFHALLSVIANYGLGLSKLAGGSMVFNFWKEGMIIILTLLLAIFLYKQKEENRTQVPFITLDTADKLILVYFALGIIHFLLAKINILPASSQLSLFVWGVKYDYLFLWTFFVARHFQFSEEQKKSFFKAAIIAGSVSLLLGLILHFLIKPENLTMLGFRNDWSTWFPNQSLAFCQRVENMDLCRMAGTFAGPNQLGAYLVILLPLLLLWYRQRTKLFAEKNTTAVAKFFSNRITVITVIIMALASLFFTLSRAAYIGIAVTTIVLALNTVDTKVILKVLKKYWAAIPIVIILLAIVFFIKRDIFLRPGSTFGHLEALILGINEMLRYPWGKGLGTAGPASYQSSAPLIPENWYLQVGIELGWIGLILFCALMAKIAQKLCTQSMINKKNTTIDFALPLFSSFAALAIMAFFLHIYEDAPANLSFFLLIGATVSCKSKHEEKPLS